MSKLDERKAELTKEFDALNDEQTKLNEDGKKLNQRLSEIRARQLHLQGRFQEAETILGEKGEGVSSSVEELVKAKPKK